MRSLSKREVNIIYIYYSKSLFDELHKQHKQNKRQIFRQKKQINASIPYTNAESGIRKHGKRA
jgi:hypothetical protein